GRLVSDWSSDVCSADLSLAAMASWASGSTAVGVSQGTLASSQRRRWARPAMLRITENSQVLKLERPSKRARPSRIERYTVWRTSDRKSVVEGKRGERGR